MDPNRRPLASRDYRWVQRLAAWLARQGVSPNGISIAGMVFATIGGACYLCAARNSFFAYALARSSGDANTADLPVLAQSMHHFRVVIASSLAGAAVSIQLRLLCNLLDGLVAVEGGRKGKAGALFNEAPDRYADIVLLAAAGSAASDPAGAAFGALVNGTNAWPGWTTSSLGWMCAAFAVATAYARAFGASLGLGQDFCGPFAKQQRMFCLTFGTLGTIFYAPLLYWTLWLIAIGTLFTFLRRIVRIYRQLP